jgi:hypothetical protein
VTQSFLRACFVSAAIAASATLALADDQAAPPTQPAASTPASTSATPATPATTQADPNAPDPNKVICKRQQVTGTRLGNTKICMTQKEWDDLAHQTSQDMQGVQRQNPSRSGTAGANN